MLNAKQLIELIIDPALKDLVMYSEFASDLLVFTCATESAGGTYIKQLKGPALGIYQMEPTTYNDIWQNYIKGKNDLQQILLYNFEASRMPSEDRLIYDLRFATAMTRIYYARIKDPLPKLASLDNLWNYYKTYYNTELGKADYHRALDAYMEFIS